MDGLVLWKTDGGRNEWLAEWNGEYAADLSVIGYHVERGHSIDLAIVNAWIEAAHMQPTSNQVFWLRTAVLVLDTWYEGGNILVVGRYQLVGDHLKVAKED